MASNRIGLVIDIDARGVQFAKQAVESFTGAAVTAADATEDAAGSADGFMSQMSALAERIGGASSETAGLSSKLLRMGGKLGLAGKAAAAAAVAVIGTVTAVEKLKTQARETARELNQRLLDAIEDVARGNESATEEFEALENVMRNLRGQTDLLRLGFDDEADAVENATAMFAENEAIAQVLDETSMRLGERLREVALRGFAVLNRQAVAAAREMIEFQIQTERARLAGRAFAEEFGEGEGLTRLGEFAGLSAAGVAAMEDVLDRALANAYRMNQLITRDAGDPVQATFHEMIRSAGVVEDVVRELQAWGETQLGASQVASMFTAVIEENNLQMQQARADLAAVTPEIGRYTEAVGMASDSTADLGAGFAAMHSAFSGAVGEGAAQSTAAAMQAIFANVSTAIDQAQAAATDRLRDTWAYAQAELLRQTDAQQAILDRNQHIVGSLASATAAAVGGAFSSMGRALGQAFVPGGKKAVDVIKGVLGDILTSVGSAAIGLGAIGLIPSPVNPVTATPAQAAGLIAAGVAATTLGSALSASASHRGGKRAAARSAAESSAGGSGTSQNVYNVTFGAGLPARAWDRALVERLESGALAAV